MPFPNGATPRGSRGRGSRARQSAGCCPQDLVPLVPSHPPPLTPRLPCLTPVPALSGHPVSPRLLGHTRRAPASRPAPLQRPPPGAPSAQTSTWLHPHCRPPSAPAAPPCSPPWCPAGSRPPLETGRVMCPALPTELGVKLALARGPRQSSARLLALPRFAFSPRDTCTVFLPACPHRRAQGCAPRDSPLRSELLTDRALSVPDGRRPGGRTASA